MKRGKTTQLLILLTVLASLLLPVQAADQGEGLPSVHLLLLGERDCNGDLHGDALEDECGVCDDDVTNDNTTCIQDCAGTWDGPATVDSCGVCDSDPDNYCIQDCYGIWGGSAFVDNCSSCVGGTTGETACTQDCNGDLGGIAYLDTCGFCVGGNTGESPSVITCVSSADQIWMDRNLGAIQVATSSTDSAAYGDLYQWGRLTDGHEKRTSLTTPATSSIDVPGHDDFITAGVSPGDWRDPPNDNLWQGVDGVNNPCPQGFRLPTIAELDIERQSWITNDAAGAFLSPLKLVAAGGRLSTTGGFLDADSAGYYWSSSLYSTSSSNLYFSGASDSGNYYGNVRSFGMSIRCIKN